MKRSGLLLLAALVAAPLLAVDINDTRLLTDPAVSAEAIAFAYANDLWVAKPDGSGVRRLTSHPGVEAGPRFSPDGRTIAFTGRYDGNVDVYVVPTAGGVPKRLTWHPNNDVVLGFTPDGAAVLFASPREVYTRRYFQLFTVPVAGGLETKLPIPNATQAAFSPDGRHIVYNPLGQAFTEWKHYRGGQSSRLLIFDVATNAVEPIPQPASRCNDVDPMWIAGDIVVFRSDRAGEFNLFTYDAKTKQVAQVTSYRDWPVVSASAGGGRIIFERNGWLYLFDLQARRETRLKIGVAADLVEMRPRYAKGAKYIRSSSLSPSGARAAFEYRGEIVTVPMEKGDDRNLTQSVAANDRSPAWSPDGKAIAWFTDASGEYELRIGPQDGHGPVRSVKVEGAGFYGDLKWSPDGSKISYTDNSESLFVLDVASGTCSKFASNRMYRSGVEHAWSPDSKWIAYTSNVGTNFNAIQLYSVEQRRSFPLTDTLSNSGGPVFDPNGKYLYFTSSTDAGPIVDWFSMWNNDTRGTNVIYLAVLAKGVVSPLAKESDEESAKKAEDGKPAPEADEKSEESAAKTDDKKPEKKPVVTKVDLDGLGQRIVALPLPAANYSDLQFSKSGELYYLKRMPANRFERGQATLAHFSLSKRKEEVTLEKVGEFELSRDGKRVLFRSAGEGDPVWSIADLGEKMDPAKQHRLGIDKVEVRIDPVAEWREIFDEAWRINRDYFYDPGMHGNDWKAVKAKYAAFLPDVVVRQDLTRVMMWMFSELSVGHHRMSGGDTLATTETIPGGLLGADYKVENGRYRFARVYGGLNWNPDLRAPLTEPGVDVKAGEYLLAVEGKDLVPPEDLYSRFERTAGRIVEITVGSSPGGKGSRAVKVVPIEDEAALRNRAWVEGNLRYVTERTGGRVAYVYVPNTSTLGYEYFRRYFFPQADRQAIIIDERHNGGGQVADYYIDILRRPLISYWATRYGADLKTPLMSIQGPKAMLIDETAGSGGDLLPWMFRKLEIGPLIGRRTWGGLVGILGFPVLMDGGTVTAPNLAIWTAEGWVVENEGVPPDIEVEQTPAEVIAGRDPQLDKAIEVVMKQLEANPPATPKRPAFPVKVQ